MRTRTLAILAAASLVLLALAVSLYTRRSTRFEAPAPKAIYPGLIDRVDEITQIRIVSKDGEFHIDRDGDTWRMRERDGYPIRTEKIRAAVLTLSDLRVLEAKTSKPENYPALGVQDPDADAPSVLVQMFDAKGDPLVSIVLGGVERSDMASISRRYVRLTGDPRVYYIDGLAEVEPTLLRWIDREIFRMPRVWTHEIVITHPDGETVRVFRPDPDTRNFALADIPEGSAPVDERDINIIGNSFVYQGLEDVASMKGVDESAVTPGPTAYARTFDGMVMTAHLFDYDGATWVTFKASTTAPMQDVLDAYLAKAQAADPKTRNAPPPLRTAAEIAAEVDKDNAKLDGWRFRLTEDAIKHLSSRMSDLTHPADEGEPATTDQPATPPAPPAGDNPPG